MYVYVHVCLSIFPLSHCLCHHTLQLTLILAPRIFDTPNDILTFLFWGYSEWFTRKAFPFACGSIWLWLDMCLFLDFFLTVMYVGREVGWHFIYFKLSFCFPKSSKRKDVSENNLFLVTDFYKEKLFHTFK